MRQIDKLERDAGPLGIKGDVGGRVAVEARRRASAAESRRMEHEESVLKLKEQRATLLKQRAMLTQEIERKGIDSSRHGGAGPSNAQDRSLERARLISKLIERQSGTQRLIDALKQGRSVRSALAASNDAGEDAESAEASPRPVAATPLSDASSPSPRGDALKGRGAAPAGAADAERLPGKPPSRGAADVAVDAVVHARKPEIPGYIRCVCFAPLLPCTADHPPSRPSYPASLPLTLRRSFARVRSLAFGAWMPQGSARPDRCVAGITGGEEGVGGGRSFLHRHRGCSRRCHVRPRPPRPHPEGSRNDQPAPQPHEGHAQASV